MLLAKTEAAAVLPSARSKGGVSALSPSPRCLCPRPEALRHQTQCCLFVSIHITSSLCSHLTFIVLLVPLSSSLCGCPAAHLFKFWKDRIGVHLPRAPDTLPLGGQGSGALVLDQVDLQDQGCPPSRRGACAAPPTGSLGSHVVYHLACTGPEYGRGRQPYAWVEVEQNLGDMAQEPFIRLRE